MAMNVGGSRRRGAIAGPVWVTADAGASYADVERVLAACRRAGVEEVGLEVQPPPG